VYVYLREGKALGSEKGKVLGYRLCYEQRREVEPELYCVLQDGQSVAKQRLDKQTSTIRKQCFVCGPCRTKSRRYRKFVARQRSGKQVSTTMGDGVSHEVRAKKLSQK
jgi:hypothetical protein